MDSSKTPQPISEDEAARRRDEVVRRMLATPPQPRPTKPAPIPPSPKTRNSK